MCGEVVPNGTKHCDVHKDVHKRQPWKSARTASSAATHARGWSKLRASILERDGYRCQMRGPRCTGIATTVDHIREVADGGSDDPSNLQAACEPCHRSKTGKHGRARQLPPQLPRGFDPLYAEKRGDQP
jgi:5-methylcytosine-specific restriction protein A